MTYVRLFLCSSGVASHGARLVAMTGGRGRAAIIGNAMDAAEPEVRHRELAIEVATLAGLGFAPEEVDLRDYVAGDRRVSRRLACFDLLWIRGGNVFVLRRAMAMSGADAAVKRLLRRDDVVYAGYSAGPCVLAPSLHGFELVDDTEDVTRAYGESVLWEGLSVLDFAFVPHVASPANPETERMDDVVAYLHAHGMAHLAVGDGEILLVEGNRRELLT